MLPDNNPRARISAAPETWPHFELEPFIQSAAIGDGACLIETTRSVVDVHMPAMTGIEAYKHLIEAGHTIPTIPVTAYPDDEERARALRDRVVCYLRKPVDERYLMQCLRTALELTDPGEKNS